MAEFEYDKLKAQYEDFNEPKVKIAVEDKEIVNNDPQLIVSRMEVDLTSGYEAGIAEINLTGVFDPESSVFTIDKVKEYFYLGSSITILLGYGVKIREIFRGFIARVNFIVPEPDGDEAPSIQLTVMDIKGNMMANRHSKRLNSKYYSDAVKEVLDNNPFFGVKDDKQKPFIDLVMDNTPDKPGGDAGGDAGGAPAGGAPAEGQQKTDDIRVEMVEESDYEFIVKAAKKFNFEFFSVGKNLYFIKAKKNETPLIEMSLKTGITSLNVGYDITGLVGKVEVRNVESDQGGFLGNKNEIKEEISLGNKAKPLVSTQSLVYIDPTVNSKETVGYRLEYFTNMASYRFGSLRAHTIGLPELIPGRFIVIKDTGKPVDNTFYLTRVRHIFTPTSYTCEMEGCANSIKKD